MLDESMKEPMGGIWDDTGEQPYMVLQYDTDSPEFARGVQVGMIWQLLHGGVEEFQIPVYASNSEMVLRMADAANFSVSAFYENEEVGGEDHEWMLITFKNKALAS